MGTVYFYFILICFGLVIGSGICLTVRRENVLTTIWTVFACTFIVFIIAATADIYKFLDCCEKHIEHLYIIPAIILSFVCIRLLFHSGMVFVDFFLHNTERKEVLSDNNDRVEIGAGVLVGLTFGLVLAYIYGKIIESGCFTNQQIRYSLGIAFVVVFVWCCILEIVSKFVKRNYRVS